MRFCSRDRRGIAMAWLLMCHYNRSPQHDKRSTRFGPFLLGTPPGCLAGRLLPRGVLPGEVRTACEGEHTVEPMPDFAQLELRFVDQLQWRYELIRPLVLFEGGTAAQRAQETQTHPQTVRTLTRRFQQQGMLGLFPDNLE